MTQKLWRFYWDCGRMGYLDGLFVATQAEVDEAVGKEIYFGEVLGKHSEIYGTLDRDELEEIDIGLEAIEKIVAITGATLSGYNPIEVYQEAKEEGKYDDEDEESDDE